MYYMFRPYSQSYSGTTFKKLLEEYYCTINTPELKRDIIFTGLFQITSLVLLQYDFVTF